MKSIAEAPPNLRQSVEQVAGRAETLAKDRVKEVPPLPFRKRVTPSLYSRSYASNGKEARDKRAQQRAVCATGIDKLGEEEYKKLLREVDLMTHTPVDINEIINKRMKEIEERLASERAENEAPERRQTRSQAQASISSAMDAGNDVHVDEPRKEVDPEQIAGSPRKRKRDEEFARKETGGKKPKQPETTMKETGGKKPKTPERKNVGNKKPKTPQRKDTGGKKPTIPERKDIGSKRPKPPAGNSKTTDDIDDSANRQKKNENVKTTDGSSKDINDVDESESRKKRQKKTMAVPLLEDDDDNVDDDLMLVDDNDKDADYEPPEDDEDDDDYPVLFDDDDDAFQEPPMRARKSTKQKPAKTVTTQQRVEKSKKAKEKSADIDDETLSLF